LGRSYGSRARHQPGSQRHTEPTARCRKADRAPSATDRISCWCQRPKICHAAHAASIPSESASLSPRSMLPGARQFSRTRPGMPRLLAADWCVSNSPESQTTEAALQVEQEIFVQNHQCQKTDCRQTRWLSLHLFVELVLPPIRVDRVRHERASREVGSWLVA